MFQFYIKSRQSLNLSQAEGQEWIKTKCFYILLCSFPHEVTVSKWSNWDIKKHAQAQKPISIPHRQHILLLTILHSDDGNLYFNSQLIITLLLCCPYTGVCNKCRAAIICFSVIERFINMENTQWSDISAGKQRHRYDISFAFLNLLSPAISSIYLPWLIMCLKRLVFER